MNTIITVQKANQSAMRIFGCTKAQLQAQHARNAKKCDETADAAHARGKRINGYSAADWRDFAKRSRELAQA